MASFTKLACGSWRVQVRHKGRYVSESFQRREDARRWATEMEGRIDRGELATSARARGDVNLSSTFECSRNDVIANIGVLAAAGGVYLFNSGWPDILVGGVIAVLFFRSAVRVLRTAWPQFRALGPIVAVALQ
jgi:Co/Zn/Cd efflux system component